MKVAQASVDAVPWRTSALSELCQESRFRWPTAVSSPHSRYACKLHVAYAQSMTTIQVRNVSEETSRALKAKAALEGRSLSDYLLRELDRLATTPSRAELLEQIASRGVATLEPAAQVLAEQRRSR